VLPAHAGPPKEIEARLWNRPDGEQLAAKSIKVTASSTLCEGKKNPKICHDAKSLLDGDPKTAWCEGDATDGVGSTLTFEFEPGVRLSGVEFVPHYAKDYRRAIENSRVAKLELKIGDSVAMISFQDLAARIGRENGEKASEAEACGDETCVSRDNRIGSAEGLSVHFSGENPDLAAPPAGARLVLTLRATHVGERYKDTCMSEVRLFAKP
jgi:hypothetical protein